MGQYGAYGYAVDHGWSRSQILDHYYGGTTAGTVSATSPMTVRILANDGQPLMAQVSDTSIVSIGPDNVPMPASGRALRVDTLGPDLYRISDAPTCAGPWTARRDVSGAEVRIRAADVSGGTSGSFVYGRSADSPVVGDWNGNGTETVGVRRGPQFLLRNTNSAGPADLSFVYGQGADIPLVGDWNGDGVDTVGVRRGNQFFLRNTNSAGPADIVLNYGRASDRPLVGNWDGVGGDGVGVQRGSTFLLSDGLDATGEISFSYGRPSDLPVVGDWDDTGTDTIGVRRSALWLLRNVLAGGNADLSYRFGTDGSLPLAGAWSGGPTYVGQRSGGAFALASAHADVSSSINLTSDDEPLGRTLQLCRGSNRTWYRGELRAAHASGVSRTVNAVGVDQYLRGVVPRESPAGWASHGGGRGIIALEAQSIAARSYAMAQNRYAPYAKTCDTTSCQVYSGMATASGGPTTIYEQPSTDQAIRNTAGGVRVRNGAVVSTEFSSSTGGVTAGGEFPSVIDEGDDTIINPNHFWTTSISHAALEAKYGQSGFGSAQITARTTTDGGRRVATIRLSFASGTVDRTGAQFRSDWGLRETWFDVGAPRGGDTVGVRDTSGPTFRLNDLPVSGAAKWTFIYGAGSDTPLSGDWDGDSRDTVGIWRAGTFHLRNALSGGPASTTVAFGSSTDTPLVGDWDGNGTDTVGYRRGRTFALRNANTPGPASINVSFGVETDIPVVGDWDGDGRDSPGVFRSGTFHLTNSQSSGSADLTVATGLAGIPVIGDWDGDGRDSVGVLAGGTFTLLIVNQTGSQTLSISSGSGRPLAGDWE